MNGRDMHYSIVIHWDPRDEIYLGTVPELPGASAHGSSYEEALREVLDAIDTWVMGEDTNTLPNPHVYPASTEVS